MIGKGNLSLSKLVDLYMQICQYTNKSGKLNEVTYYVRT